MEENITFDISFEEVERIVLEYYKKEFNDDNIILKSEIQRKGYYHPERDEYRINLTRTIQINNYQAISELKLSYDDIDLALINTISNEEYSVFHSFVDIENKKVVIYLKRKEKEKQKIKE